MFAPQPARPAWAKPPQASDEQQAAQTGSDVPRQSEVKNAGDATFFAIAGGPALIALAFGIAEVQPEIALGVFYSGFLLGPSMGHFYVAGRPKITTGMIIRAAGPATVALAAWGISATGYSAGIDGWTLVELGIVTVASTLVVGTFYDIVSAREAAHEANAKAKLHNLRAAPLLLPGNQATGTGTVTGFAVSGSF